MNAGLCETIEERSCCAYCAVAVINQVNLDALCLPLDQEILLAIDAGDLLIALAPPSGLSARNALAGKINALTPTGSAVYAHVGPWLAHLTPAAVKDLALEVGTPVWLVAKTHSWRVAAG